MGASNQHRDREKVMGRVLQILYAHQILYYLFHGQLLDQLTK